MIVEDDNSMLEILTTLLEIEGYSIVTLDDRQEINDWRDIVAIIRREQPAVVYLDIHFRHINGLDVLREVRKDPALHGSRILISSGMDLPRESRQHGADAFLLKPFLPDELLNIIQELVKPGLSTE
jgi:CheY-like chemotaxis protein